MATSNFKAFKQSDEELLKSLAEIAKELDDPQAHIKIKLIQHRHKGIIPVAIVDIATNEIVQQLIKSNSALANQMELHFPSFDHASIIIAREQASDNVNVNINDQTDDHTTIRLISAAHRRFRAYERTESTDKILGDELAEFYRKREEALLRLEHLTQSLIDQNEQYRIKLDQEKYDFEKNLTEKYQGIERELTTAHQKRMEDLRNKEAELEAIKSEIDDRQSRHARRQIRKDLKDALAKRGEQFSLTRTTVKKRIPIHALFAILIIISGAFVAKSFLLSVFESGTSFSSFEFAKLVTSSFTLIATIIFYIRWNDSWFRRHADEEFRLKQLELDIDRASWVVEMALEWKEERGNEISPHLIEKLTENLFVQNSSSEKATHPSEDLASAIINASSGLSLKIPGVGEVALDRRSIKRLRKELDNAG